MQLLVSTSCTYPNFALRVVCPFGDNVGCCIEDSPQASCRCDNNSPDMYNNFAASDNNFADSDSFANLDSFASSNSFASSESFPSLDDFSGSENFDGFDDGYEEYSK